MTLEERLAVIERKAAKDRAIDMEKKEMSQLKLDAVLHEIQELTPRIKALITIANKCIDEGVAFPSAKETERCGYGKGRDSYSFLADGIHHHVGFMNCRRGYRKSGESPYNKVEYIGIVNGGFCGVWDFYTNGTKTFLKHEKDGSVKAVEFKYLNDFLHEFGVFEAAFYKWIDSLA